MKKAAEQKETPQYWQQTDKSVKRLKAEFSKLLDQNLTEQNYQLFMEENTRLVPREFVQNHGIHFSLVLRKLGFGADYKSDFTFQRARTIGIVFSSKSNGLGQSSLRLGQTTFTRISSRPSSKSINGVLGLTAPPTNRASRKAR
jgi:hypothetical protein